MSQAFDIDRFLGLPRLSDLRCSPDGSRLVVSVARPVPDGTRLHAALWELDPAGQRPPRQLTHSAQGESAPAFLADGSLLFLSSRPAAVPGPASEPRAALWLLPASGGEARALVAPGGGIEALRAARTNRTVAFVSGRFAASATLDEDEARARARVQAGVSAILFERYPIRHWDHYLGPRERHLLALHVPEDETVPVAEPRDLFPDAGAAFDALEHVGFDLTPDGSIVVATVASLAEITHPAVDLVAFDVAAGTSRRLTGSDARYEDPACSPDGRWLAAVRETLGDPEHASTRRLWLLNLETGEGRDLAPSADLWPTSPVWSPDGSAVFFLSDHEGSVALFRVEVGSGTLTCLSRSGTLSDPCPTPDGTGLFALWSTLRVPPRPVRLAAKAVDQHPAVLPSPGADEASVGAPGRVERLAALTKDGTTIGAWLMLPSSATAEQPAPLVVFVHGGPLGSWSDGWHWRWNPQLLAARGYAVLLPDPAFSTGYGQALVDRGWGRWNEAPFTDMLAAADAALARPEIDPHRTALMGGSFGGYMANWVAGHTDRFRCIVTHASLWDLRGFHGTTDDGNAWELEFGDPYRDPRRYVEQSPSAAIGSVRTPMLVIHGELDQRVPISEGLRLWTDLQRHGVESKFLYFPDENHWVLKPQNARLWYQTVLAFLDQHVLGVPWERPPLL